MRGRFLTSRGSPVAMCACWRNKERLLPVGSMCRAETSWTGFQKAIFLRCQFLSGQQIIFLGMLVIRARVHCTSEAVAPATENRTLFLSHLLVKTKKFNYPLTAYWIAHNNQRLRYILSTKCLCCEWNLSARCWLNHTRLDVAFYNSGIAELVVCVHVMEEVGSHLKKWFLFNYTTLFLTKGLETSLCGFTGTILYRWQLNLQVQFDGSFAALNLARQFGEFRSKRAHRQRWTWKESVERGSLRLSQQLFSVVRTWRSEIQTHTPDASPPPHRCVCLFALKYPRVRCGLGALADGSSAPHNIWWVPEFRSEFKYTDNSLRWWSFQLFIVAWAQTHKVILSLDLQYISLNNSCNASSSLRSLSHKKRLRK